MKRPTSAPAYPSITAVLVWAACLTAGRPAAAQPQPQAQPQDESAGPLGADEVAVQVVLDDRAAQRVSAPIVAVSQVGVDALELRDDGLDGDATALDHIWSGRLVVRRTQYLAFQVRDGATALSDLSVFLPSTGKAAVNLRTLDGPPGVELAAEPSASTTTQTPTDTSSSAATAALDERLSYVLWIAVALFAVGFAYLRSVLWRIWQDELRPTLRKLNRVLDRQLAEDPAVEDPAVEDPAVEDPAVEDPPDPP